MIKNRRISIIVPAYNEENMIGQTLEHLNFPWIDEIIVVNDGSSDNTLEVIRKYSVSIINFEQNRGKGKAVEEGVKQAKGDLFVLVDADLGQSVKEMVKLIEPIISGKAEVTLGILPVQGGGIGLVRGLADYGLRFVTGKGMKAPLSGQRVITRQVIDKIIPFCPGFGLEIGMDIDLIRANIEIKELECNFKHQITGQSIAGYLHRGKQFLAILVTLWQKRRK